MVQINENKSDDFFDIIEKEERIENPFDDDEIIFKDESGNIKVIKGTAVGDAGKVQTQAAPTSSVKMKIAPAKPQGKPRKLDKDIDRVVKLSGIHFNDAKLEKRFRNIVQSRFRSVRSQVETREILLDSFVNGGMGFDSQHTDKIMNIISEQREKLDDKLRQQVSHQPFSDLQAEAHALLEGTAEITEPATQIKEKPAMIFKPKGGQENKLDAKILKKSIPKAKPIPVPKPASIARVIARTDESKPKIEDIKFEPKLTGPIEEIGSMTVEDFRRLGGDPEQTIQKIIQKIDILEEESFVKKTQAIKAWKDSPVNRLYLDIGDQSIEEKIPIVDIINQRQQNNQPYLSEEEIDAVIDLNHKLRY